MYVYAQHRDWFTKSDGFSQVSHSDNFCATQMMRVELVKFNKRYGFAKMRGTCHVGANLVCEADLNLVMGK